MDRAALERLDSAFSLHWECHPPAARAGAADKGASPPAKGATAGETIPADALAAARAHAPKARPGRATPTPPAPAPHPVLRAAETFLTQRPGSRHREAGLCLPILGQEASFLTAIEELHVPALSALAMSGDEAARRTALLDLRDALFSHLTARTTDFVALGAAVEPLLRAEATPAVAALQRLLRAEALLWVRRKRHADAVAQATHAAAAGAPPVRPRPPGLSPLERLEHQLVAALVGGR